MSAIDNPQTQKEIAKLFQYMTEFLSRLFKKNNGQNIVQMNEGQLKRLNDDLKHVIAGQEKLAEELKEKGKYPEAAYMKARAQVLNDLQETLHPSNMEKFAEAPENVSPQQFAQKFQEKFEKIFEDALKDPDFEKGLRSVEAHKLNFDELNKLDKEIVESRFAYGSDRDKMIHTGLSVSNSVMGSELQKALDNQMSAAKENGKDMEAIDPTTGLKSEKGLKEPGQKRGVQKAPEINTFPPQ